MPALSSTAFRSEGLLRRLQSLTRLPRQGNIRFSVTHGVRSMALSLCPVRRGATFLATPGEVRPCSIFV
jgi:hypothetical protein